MPDFLFQVLIRLAVMLPTLMIVAALIWCALKWFGVVATGAPFDARDMRTWPLRFALIEAALFALTFAIVIVVMGEGAWSAAVAGGVSAIVAVGLGPLLVERFAR
jgi:hypothetical protein